MTSSSVQYRDLTSVVLFQLQTLKHNPAATCRRVQCCMGQWLLQDLIVWSGQWTVNPFPRLAAIYQTMPALRTDITILIEESTF